MQVKRVFFINFTSWSYYNNAVKIFGVEGYCFERNSATGESSGVR